MSFRYPAIKRLPIHLEKQQPVLFNEDQPITEVLERCAATELTAFFNTMRLIQKSAYHIYISLSILPSMRKKRNGKFAKEKQIHLAEYIQYIHRKVKSSI